MSHWPSHTRSKLTSLNCTLPSSPSSRTVAYAASLCRNSCASVISSDRNMLPIPLPPSQYGTLFRYAHRRRPSLRNCSIYFRQLCSKHDFDITVSVLHDQSGNKDSEGMFSAKDLSSFVCKAADALQLKFGRRKAKVHFSLPLSCFHALLLRYVAMSLPPL